ncbi:hypothetical protein F7725_023728 [Dissostichus mawsoni]|uniref:Acylphosphatase-like domain-containing protein n=1 Tax=Dissostichus mawsoni TaxID=36200 RepID=A0A7J5XZ49_DISMA|nr:hypothetical protein F7725_023728 [Dissostichus mawsoni]
MAVQLQLSFSSLILSSGLSSGLKEGRKSRGSSQRGSLSLTLLLLCVTLCLRMGEAAGGNKLTSVDFEIFGNVQVYGEAGSAPGSGGLGEDTHGGTVVGQVQGPAHKVEEMKVWLSEEGSPSSRITRFCFSNQRNIDKLELSGFKTRF